MRSVHASGMVQNVTKIVGFHIHLEESKALVKCFKSRKPMAGQSHPGNMYSNHIDF